MNDPLYDLTGFDLEDALDRFGGNKVTLIKFINLMVGDFLKRIPAIQLAIDSEDYPLAATELHTMIGTASALAAVDLVSMCRLCESMCHIENQGKAQELMRSIELSVSRIKVIS